MFERILVPLDGSHLAERAIPHARAIAETFGSQIILLHVLERAQTADRLSSIDPVSWHLRKTEAETYLNRLTSQLQEAGLNVEYSLQEGNSAEQIINFAYGNDIGLITLTSHGLSGLSGWNISSVVQKIILRAYVPVMIVRAYKPTVDNLECVHYHRVLVPLDCSPRAECVWQHVTVLAEHHKSKLLLAHVVRRPELVRRSPPTQEDLDLVNRLTERNHLEAGKYLKQLQTQGSLDIEIRLLIDSNVTATLHNLVKQEDADLVVLCAHGQSGGTRWPYGNVALSFIAYGSTPLLIIQDVSLSEAERSEAEMAAKEYKGH